MENKQIENIRQEIEEKGALVILSAVGSDGNPYSEVGVKVKFNDKKQIVYYQYLETSQLQKNLVNSIWFNKKLSIVVIAKDGRNYHITAKPDRTIIAGHIFEQAYEEALCEYGADTDLSALWLIDIEKITENTYAAARTREILEHPLLMHLDHLYKE